jgi:DNA modification methylase
MSDVSQRRRERREIDRGRGSGDGVNPTFDLRQGDALELLRAMPDESVHCCVTSPPYWGMRDYGIDGQLGLEATPVAYVERMVEVFREVRRVLRRDGTLWLNLGDCYATGAGAVGDHPGGGEQGARWRGDVDRHRDDRRRAPNSEKQTAAAMGPQTQPNRMPISGLKPKDLVGMPWRVAFALQADGWWLRSDIIWAKPNPMPESVTDRPTKAHEYLFLFAKSRRYYYDAEAVAEPIAEQTEVDRVDSGRFTPDRGFPGATDHGNGRLGANPNGRRNKRTVWEIATAPFPAAHFATFPPALVEPCVLAGTAPGSTVLDPFAGAGTTGLVALRLGRSFIGLELNPRYVEMARRRIVDDAPLLNVSAT